MIFTVSVRPASRHHPEAVMSGPAAPGRMRRDQARRRGFARVAAELQGLRPLVPEGGMAVPGPGGPGRGSRRGRLVEALPEAAGLAGAAGPADLRRAERRRLSSVP